MTYDTGISTHQWEFRDSSANRRLIITDNGHIGVNLTSGSPAAVSLDVFGNGPTIYLHGTNSSIMWGNIISNNIQLQAPSSILASYTLNLPTAQGLANTSLTNDGSGNLSFALPYAPVSTKTSNYPITTSDKVILANAAITITLPTAVGISGQTFVIKNITASSSVTVNTTSSQTIDGQLTQILNSMSAMQVISNGSNWNII